MKRFFPNTRPLQKSDFFNERVRAFIRGLLPALNISDPQVQHTLRDMRIAALFDEIFGIGKAGETAADGLNLPALFIQGQADQPFRTPRIQQLVNPYVGSVTYYEIEGETGLVRSITVPSTSWHLPFWLS